MEGGRDGRKEIILHKWMDGMKEWMEEWNKTDRQTTAKILQPSRYRMKDDNGG